MKYLLYLLAMVLLCPRWIRGAENPNQEDYDPFAHRILEHPTNDLETLIHLLKGSMGSGILAMPVAFAHAGLVFGLCSFFFIGVVCTYCIHILIRSAHALYYRNRVPSMSYAELAEAAFLAAPDRFHRWSKEAKFTINFFLVLNMLGCCTVYVLFVTENLRQVVQYASNNTASDEIRLYMACLLPFLIAINLIRNLKYLAPLSFVANCLVFTSMSITFYYYSVDLPPMAERPWIVSIYKFPRFFGTSIFALESIGVVMSLENNMINPRHFIGCPGVLNISMTAIMLLYACTGFFGFLKYGEETKASITLNLPQDEILGQSVKLMIAIAIFFTFALQFYVPIEIVLRGLKPKFPNRPLLLEYILRISFVTFIVTCAIIIPNLAAFISLTGAVCLSTLGIIFPAIIETLTFYKEDIGPCHWRICLNTVVIILGVAGFFSGTYVSIRRILKV